MLLADLVATSGQVAARSGRLEKIALLADLLGKLPADEIDIAIGFLIGWPRQGRLGVSWRSIQNSEPPPAAERPSLDLERVDHLFERIKAVAGKGSAAVRSGLVRDLFAAATEPERRFLSGLISGEVRQGALEGVMTDAVARAAGISAPAIRRAAMLAGELGAVARAALTQGEAGLAHYRIELFRPIQPMLADSAADVAEALAELGRAAFELKLDGARIQVHKSGREVRVFTRNLNDVTEAVPEIVEAVRAFPASELILDGEAIALDSGGRPLPFQVTMRRFGRKLDVTRVKAELPVRCFFFDLLLVDGTELLDAPLEHRLGQLARVVPPANQVERIVTDDRQLAEAFEASALARGHEGVMAKALDAPYAAGRRGSAWLKIKKARTLDLVVLAVEWGSGRRKGWLSNIHLGARDPAGGFVMLGKTFKGMTDEMLAWQTRELLARETHRDESTVYVRPELVVEVAFNEVQASSQYPGGVTLRFARVKGYRPDKSAQDADTIDSVRAGLADGGGGEP